MKYLKEILVEKKKEIEKLKENQRLVEAAAVNTGRRKGRFVENIKKGKVNIIAEIKKASPSRGIINDGLDIEKTALLYDRFKSFICGISVLTEPLYFKGNYRDMTAVRGKTSLPVLRKDFIFNRAQIYQSAALGADCVLLISSLLGSKKLKKLYDLASGLGLDVLVEVHTTRELEKALDTGASFIGINNRNLKNMSVNQEVAYDCLSYIKSRNISDKILVCESGIKNVGYIRDLFFKGISTFLIGEYFMASSQLERTLNNMEWELKKENLL